MSELYLKKLMNEQFSQIKKGNWFKTICYWLIDPRFSEVKELDKFLKEQLDGTKTDDKLYLLAQSLRGKNPYDTIYNVIKYVDTFKRAKDKVDIWTKANEMISRGYGDCLAWNTKVLLPDYSTIYIENINIGDFICGKDGKFVKVLNKWDKGILPTKKIFFNNGTSIIATKEHKFILKNGKEILCSNLKIRDKLKQINEIEKEYEQENQDYWYLKGLYIADGWSDHTKKYIYISGKDGFKKEKQKEWVKQYCIKNKISYYWHERYIRVGSHSLYFDFKNCGCHTIEKHVDFIPKTKNNIIALLQGLSADAYTNKKGTITYGTISNKLKEQIRIMYRLIGKSVHERLWKPTKTQFGKNDIWRITIRNKRDRPITILDIKDNEEENVYDIEVEDNEIYLPENDCIVHNCEDLNNLVYILCRLAGIGSSFLMCCIGDTDYDIDEEYDHFYTIFFDARRSRWVSLDVAYYPEIKTIDKKITWACGNGLKYSVPEYIFNEDGIWRFKK